MWVRLKYRYNHLRPLFGKWHCVVEVTINYYRSECGRVFDRGCVEKTKTKPKDNICKKCERKK